MSQSGATGKTGRVIHPPGVSISVPCLWKGTQLIIYFRSSQLSDFQLYLKWIPPRSYLQCICTHWHSLHHEERILCHRDGKTTQTPWITRCSAGLGFCIPQQCLGRWRDGYMQVGCWKSTELSLVTSAHNHRNWYEQHMESGTELREKSASSK